MKNSLKLLLGLIGVIIVLLAVYIYCTVLSDKGNNVLNLDVGGNMVLPNFGNKREELNTEYMELEQLPVEYSINDAINDRCFVIAGEIYNEEILNKFMLEINEKQDTQLRIVEMTNAGYISIIDLKTSGDVLIIREDYSRNEISDILSNEYDLSKYVLISSLEKLQDGTETIIYLLEEISGKERIPLFAYVKDRINNNDRLPNKFDGIIKNIDKDLMNIEPLENTIERNVSNEVFITLVEGKFNGKTFEEGQKITITYTGEITKIAGLHQIEKIISIE